VEGDWYRRPRGSICHRPSLTYERRLASDDDAKARQFAETLGLEVHGSIGLLLWSFGEGLIQKDQAYNLLDGLAHSSLWVSERVLDKARQTIELLSA